ncbi:hypothetical protein D3C84_146550 [compost metagenome]
MAMVSSSLGSSTSTFWKRRSSAASFSTYWRYSSRVVAPTQCSSPRASAGLSMLPASIEPSALPAPTMVCSSSMNRMTRPSCLPSSLSTALRRSSNSPRNLAPAISAPMSSDSRRLSLRPSGTSPLTMRWARPSTMAVLPTPGSPISTGLFLVRRCRTWMVRRISSSRPITGSSLPSSARLVMSTVYLSSAWRDSSALGSLTASPPRRLLMAFSSACLLTPWASSSLPRRVPLSSAASSTSSLEMYWSPFCWARRSAWLSRRARSCDMFTSPVGFWIFGRSSSALLSAWRRAAMSKPTCSSSGLIEPPCWSSRASSRCSGSMAE